METYIYTLTDPRTNQIKYVGKTNNPYYRFRMHIHEAKNGNTYKQNWIKGLLKSNLEPVFEIIDTIDNKDWMFWEQFWISQCKTWGFKLTNLGIGGEGSSGLKHTEKTKQLISSILKEKYSKEPHPKKGKKESEISKKNKSESSKGNTNSKGNVCSEHNKKLFSEMYTGTRIGTDNPFYGQTHTEATKQKISAIHKGRKKGPLSEETKLKPMVFASGTKSN